MSFLADRTEERRAPVLYDAFDGAFASRGDTGFAFTVIDTEMVLEIAEFSVGPAVIAQRRAAGLDRRMEHRFDGIDERDRARIRRVARREGGGAAPRRQARPMQGLADIDVAEP